jgi:exopolyphosphatase/guanosine-5'-triphosphate,3'-diphosphate pyrophosphatase
MPYQSGHQSLGVIDIGSNSVRMVIYDLSHNPPEKIFNEKVIAPLGRDLGITGDLYPDAVIGAFKALQAYKLLSEVYHVVDLKIVGTAALRDARDGAAFIDRIRREIGLDIQVISGDAEASFAARGVLMFDPLADGVVADFGGGSLELARIHDNIVHDTISLPLGAYRVQAMGEKAPQVIHDFLAPLLGRFGTLRALYAIGGSWRVLAAAYMKDKGQQVVLQGYRIPAVDMIEFCNKISSMNEGELQIRYRLEAHQLRLAHVSAAALGQVLRGLAPQDFVVSTAGVRDGVAHEYLSSVPKKG